MPTSLSRAVLRGIRRLISNRTQEEEAEDDALAESEIEEEEEEYHTELGSDLVLLCFSIVALILVAIWAERRHVPSSLAAVLVGAFLGLVLRLAGAESAPNLHSLLFFDEELFLYLLLPPIIFEAGFSLSRQYFFNNLLTILIFAVLGTLMTTFVVGQACQIFGKAGTFRTGDEDALDFRVSRDAYTFGALISATDPVATLSIMGAYQVDPLMYTLVAGESVLNDAVAIVLVRILQSLGPSAFQSRHGFLLASFQFVWVSIGSILVGLLIALPSAILLKRIDIAHHGSGGGGFELSLILVLGYLPFPTAEAVHCSGILALFVCSVLIGHYHIHSLSSPARISVELTLRSLAHLTETFVFMYMGLDLVAQRGAVDDLFDADLGAAGVDEATSTRHFVLFAILVVPLARVVVIPPLVLLANQFRGRKRSLSVRETLFLVFAGLRGAIAYALARSSASKHQRTIVAATTGVVLFTTFVLGGTTRVMLKKLGMIAAPSNAASSSHQPSALPTSSEDPHDNEQPTPADSSSGSPAVKGGGGPGTLTMLDDESIRTARIDGGALGHWFQNVDAVYLQPIFGNDHAVGTHSPGGSPHKKGVKGTAAREIEFESIAAASSGDADD